MNESDARVKAFLKDLAQVCKKHGVGIDGCGCCESPYLVGVCNDAEYGFLSVKENGEYCIVCIPRDERGFKFHRKTYIIEGGCDA